MTTTTWFWILFALGWALAAVLLWMRLRPAQLPDFFDRGTRSFKVDNKIHCKKLLEALALGGLKAADRYRIGATEHIRMDDGVTEICYVDPDQAGPATPSAKNTIVLFCEEPIETSHSAAELLKLIGDLHIDRRSVSITDQFSDFAYDVYSPKLGLAIRYQKPAHSLIGNPPKRFRI